MTHNILAVKSMLLDARCHAERRDIIDKYGTKWRGELEAWAESRWVDWREGDNKCTP